MRHLPSFARLTLTAIAATLALGACSVLESDKVDYKSASKGTTLEVPPDLTQLSQGTRYSTPGSTVTASGQQAHQASHTGVPVAANRVADVRIERAGNQRWLVVDRPADKLWSAVRDFWQENGFLLTLDQSELGILETDWAENRAKLPQDFIRQTIGKVFDSLYSTSERDKFRTRLERNAQGGTEIYISHRGLQEVYSSSQKDQTVWQPRAADPELEAEFLRRLMVKLGVAQEQSKAILAAAGAAAPAAQVVTVGNAPVVQFTDEFDRAWRRVGLALDRTGFTVEDRDRSKGLYFVRYVDPTAERQDPGFFGKLLGKKTTAAAASQYRVQVRSEGNNSIVTVLNQAGAPDTSANAQRILKVIADDLK